VIRNFVTRNFVALPPIRRIFLKVDCSRLSSKPRKQDSLAVSRQRRGGCPYYWLYALGLIIRGGRSTASLGLQESTVRNVEEYRNERCPLFWAIPPSLPPPPPLHLSWYSNNGSLRTSLLLIVLSVEQIYVCLYTVIRFVSISAKFAIYTAHGRRDETDYMYSLSRGKGWVKLKETIARKPSILSFLSSMVRNHQFKL
jgi:hypothetical protein